MHNTTFGVSSSRIRDEKTLKYLGTARIEVDVLVFPHSDGPDAENVDRLRKLFRLQRDFEPEAMQNRIPAVIDESQLRNAIMSSGLPAESMMSAEQVHPRLDFPPGFQLECLRGEDRVEAVKGLFRSSNLRWVVDLFAAGLSIVAIFDASARELTEWIDLSIEAKRDIQEEYASERKLDDGEIYYKMRQYQGIFGQEDPFFEQRWRARIATLPDAKTTQPCLDQLLSHPKFSAAFDAFRHIPALYSGLRLSVVGKMISTRCHEELLTYLRHIKDFWYYIFDGNEIAMGRLDRASVQALEQKAPGACQKEAQRLYGRIRSGDILNAFSDLEKEQIWSRLCSTTTDCMVPSLRGFFNDLNYIKLAADCMKRLVTLRRDDTIRRALGEAYKEKDHGNDECLVEVSGSAMKVVQASGRNNFDLRYRQLWLYAIREHADMPAEVKRKTTGAKTANANETVLFQFASLAHKFGFQSNEITDMLRCSPDREIARRLLLTARNPASFQYEDIESCIAIVEEVIARARPLPKDDAEPEYVIEDSGKTPKRSGPPAIADMARDKSLMYLDVLHGSLPRQEPKLTSLFIQRSTYFAFFGRDTGVSIENINAAQSVPPGVDANVAFGTNSSRHSTYGGVMQTELDGLQRRLEYLRGKVADAESQLEQLQDNIASKQREENELQNRVEGFRETEAERIIRLGSLQNVVQARERQINELGKGRTDLGEEIRLDLLSADGQCEGAQEKAQRAQILQLSEQAIEKQNSFNELSDFHRQKQQEVRGVEEERLRLQAEVDELLAQKRVLSEEVQAKLDTLASLAETEKGRRSVGNKLGATELEMRQKIDQPETCLQNLQRTINDATEDEKELHPRNARTGATENIVADGDADRDLPREPLGAMVRRELDLGDVSESSTSPGPSPVAATPPPAGGSMARPALLNAPTQEVVIQFKVFEGGDWRVKNEVTVDTREPSEVRRVATKYMRKNFGLFNSNYKALTAENCFERVTSNGTNTILVIPAYKVDREGPGEESRKRKRK